MATGEINAAGGRVGEGSGVAHRPAERGVATAVSPGDRGGDHLRP